MVEITQTIKNADIVDIPHHYVNNDLTVKSIIALDPLFKLTTLRTDIYLENSSEANDEIYKILKSNVLINSNDSLDAGFHSSVIVQGGILK